MRSSDSVKLIVLIGAGLVSAALADPNPVSPKSGGSNTEPVISGSGSGSGTTSAGSAGGGSGSSSQGGSNLYYQPDNDDARSDDHGEGLDEAPVRTGQRHEKVFRVDSLKSLPSTGVDTKFKGSLIDNSIESIKKLSPKSDSTTNPSPKQPLDPRFQSKTVTLINELDATDPQKKTEAKPAKSDTTPSPTPSATASPATKVSDEAKR